MLNTANQAIRNAIKLLMLISVVLAMVPVMIALAIYDKFHKED